MRTKHVNDEATIRCPVDSCDAEPLARGAHLHVRRSDGNGHGPQGDIPPDVDLENLQYVGTRPVSMEYPDERETDDTMRLCPFCGDAFTGSHGVFVHLGQKKGQGPHPSEYPESMDKDSFPKVDREFLEHPEEGVGSRLLRLLKAEGREKEASIVETIIEE